MKRTELFRAPDGDDFNAPTFAYFSDGKVEVVTGSEAIETRFVGWRWKLKDGQVYVTGQGEEDWHIDVPGAQVAYLEYIVNKIMLEEG